MRRELFENIATSFWHNDEYAQKYYAGTIPTDKQVAEIESELGYKLPQSYIEVIKQHNGGVPRNTCFPTSVPTCWADNHIAISGIMGIDKNKPYSLCGEMGNRFWIEEWGYPAIGLAICTTPTAGHDMIFLDYRNLSLTGEPSAVHIDQENSYKITTLAASFENFIQFLSWKRKLHHNHAFVKMRFYLLKTKGTNILTQCARSYRNFLYNLWHKRLLFYPE